jgi:type II secretory pathway component GspD/PulD (secretin)
MLRNTAWTRRRLPFALGIALAWCSLVTPASAQAPRDQDTDLLDQTRRREQVAAQKVETDLRSDLRDVQRLMVSSPSRAIERLKKLLEQVEGDSVLSADRRESLKRMLTDRIRVAQTDLDESAKKREKLAQKSGRQGADDDRRKEGTNIKQTLKKVGDLQDKGKTEEASREAGELAKQHPTQPPVQASERSTSAADRVAKANVMRKDGEQRLLGAYRDIDKSALPPKGDIEYPADWKERTKGRTATVQLTAKEKEILKTLSTPISVDFKNSRLQDVLEYLRTYTGANILIDEQALKDAEASYDTPVTLKVRNLSLRTVLRKVLGDIGMTYVVKDEVIQATSAQRAKELMVVRRYYIGDLLANMTGGMGLTLPSPLLAGVISPLNPFNQAAQEARAASFAQAAKQLIEMIENSVDTQSWQVNGGNGSITFNAPSMSLVIKQSAEVHAMLSGSGALK